MASTPVELLVKGIRKQYSVVGDTYDVMGKKLFHVDDSNARYEQVQTYIPMGLPQRRGEGSPMADGFIAANFGKTYFHDNFGLKVVLPNEYIKDDLYGLMTRWVSGQASSMAEAYATNDEILPADFLMNIGFGTAPVVGSPDGQPIFSLSHPVSRLNTGTLLANRPDVVTSLSMTALQAARANLEQQRKANYSTKIKNRIARLVFNPNLEEIAVQLVKGDWVPNNLYRNMNTLQMKDIELFSWPYWEVSGSLNSEAFNGWMVQGEKHYLQWFVRQAVDFDSQGIVAINSTLFASTQRQSLGHDDWRGVFGDTGP